MKTKEQKLRFHKRIATALFLLMTIIYVTMVIWQKKAPHLSFIGFVKAFAEAAMVGALADWFAVTALFHKPLDLPIPHTDLIENRKKDIGDNLGGFVVDNFLKPENIRPYIEHIKVSTLIAQWLSKEKNKQLIITEIQTKIEDFLAQANDDEITLFIADKSKNLLDKLQLNMLSSKALLYIIDQNEHQKLIHFIFEKIASYILANEVLIQQKVSEKSSFLIPNFIDKSIAKKITSGLADYMNEVVEDEQHPVRRTIENQIINFTEDLKSPEWEHKFKTLQAELLQPEQLQTYAQNLWLYFKKTLQNDVSKTENSNVKQYFEKSIQQFTEQLNTDQKLQQRIDQWVRKSVYQFVLKNRNEVGTLISNTVGNWQGRELSEKLELEVGKDLQFIRINGTLVGGLVGLIIYTITHYLL